MKKKTIMKNFFNILVVMFLTIFSTSCIKHDLEDLEVYSENDIVSVQGIYWRWIEDEKNPGSNENKISQKSLSVKETNIDKENATADIKFQIPSNFPKDQISELTAAKLVVILNISPASVIEPIEGAPKLGTPGDWTKSNKYKITAANGSSKVWTVTVSQIK